MSTAIDRFTRETLAPDEAGQGRKLARGREPRMLPIIPQPVVPGSPIELALQRHRIGGRWCRRLLSPRAGQVGALAIEGGAGIAAPALRRLRPGKKEGH